MQFRSPRHLYFPDVGLLPFIATTGDDSNGIGNGYDEFFGDLAAAAVSGDATIDYDAFVKKGDCMIMSNEDNDEDHNELRGGNETTNERILPSGSLTLVS